MKILAIETSCDETAISVVEADGVLSNAQFKILGNQLLSQIDVHKEYGGVFPNLAKREHAKNLIPLLKEALKESDFLIVNRESRIMNLKDVEKILNREPGLYEQFTEFISTIEKPGIDAIAVTYGPGLEPALWVGINLAKALSLVWDIPVVPVNHMEGHVFAALLQKSQNSNLKSQIFEIQNVQFPILSLLISGAHTELVLMKDWSNYELLGSTRDDAVGESFDKVARMLGLPYPGGPEIEKLAAEARQHTNKLEFVGVLPRPMIHSDNLDFSFSGLKTAVLYTIKKAHEDSHALSHEEKAALAREFQEAATDVLVAKTKKALEQTNAKTLVVGGGVSASAYIRERLQALADEQGITLLLPERPLSTDNAIMIAIAGWYRSQQKQVLPPDSLETLKAEGNLKLAE